MATGTQDHACVQLSIDISSAGLRRLQKLAASMTPPVNPKRESITESGTSFFIKKTTAAPKAVINQVNKAARPPCIIGCKLLSQSISHSIRQS